MRRLALVLSCSVLLACGGEDDSGGDEEPITPEPVTPEEVGPETPEGVDVPAETPSYSIHEWGLIDVDLSEEQVEYAAGPGRAEGSSATASADRPGGGTRPAGGGTTATDPDLQHVTGQAIDTANQLLGAVDQAAGGQLPIRPQVEPQQRPEQRMPRRKPVLYFHLTEPTDGFTFSLSVNLGTGRLVEHFPGGQLQDHGVRWADVALASDSCQGGPYPTEDGPACADVADGYCEAAELADYVANDAGCLTFGGMQHNFLFYRGDGPAPSLPVTITRGDDGTVRVTNDSMGEPVGPMLRLRRGADGVIQVAQAALPAEGSSIAIGIPADPAADGHREILRTQLDEIGLTAGEADAFEQAWFGELFDGEAPTPHAFTDAVLFFLPQDAVDGYAHLEATPAPAATVRAMAVRAGWTQSP